MTPLPILILLCTGLSLSAAEPGAAELLGAAAAADQAREESRELREQWQAEQARHALLSTSLADEAARVQAQIATLETALAEQAAAAALRQAELEQANQLEQHVAELASRISRTLAELDLHTPLGLQQGKPTPGSNELAAAFSALATAEHQARVISRRQLVGQLADGSALAVEVLVIGGCAAWWQHADGRAGRATQQAGTLLLESADAKTAAAIAAIFAMHAGERAAQLIDLPEPGA